MRKECKIREEQPRRWVAMMFGHSNYEYPTLSECCQYAAAQGANIISWSSYDGTQDYLSPLLTLEEDADRFLRRKATIGELRAAVRAAKGE